MVSVAGAAGGVGLPHLQHLGPGGLHQQAERHSVQGGGVHRDRRPGRLRQVQPHVRHPGTNYFDSVTATICYYVIMLVSQRGARGCCGETAGDH